VHTRIRIRFAVSLFVTFTIILGLYSAFRWTAQAAKTDAPVIHSEFQPALQATFTPSSTARPSYTPTATPTPDCALLALVDAGLEGNKLVLRVRNNNALAPVFLTRASVPWHKHTLFPGMYAARMRFAGWNSFWDGIDLTPGTDLDNTAPGWIDDWRLRAVDAGTVAAWQIEFLNGPPDLSAYYTLHDFTGTTLYFGTEWNGGNQNCSIALTLPAPTPPMLTATPTSVPSCDDFAFQFQSFDTDAVVRAVFTNQSPEIVQITGFTGNWNTAGLPPIALDFVSVGIAIPFHQSNITIWDGEGSTPPVSASASGGAPGWHTVASVLPGHAVFVWFDFDGVTTPLGDQGYVADDMAGTSLTVEDRCTLALDTASEPHSTFTPTATHTPTPTPSKTPTPTATNTATRTPDPFYTPSGCVIVGPGLVVCMTD